MVAQNSSSKVVVEATPMVAEEDSAEAAVPSMEVEVEAATPAEEAAQTAIQVGAAVVRTMQDPIKTTQQV